MTISSSPRWVQRPVVKQARASGGSVGLIDDILSRRDIGDLSRKQLSSPSLVDLDDPWLLPNARVAADRIAQAVSDGQRIAIETDYDVDGSTSHVILEQGLCDKMGAHPDNVRGFVGHRLTEGYGLSQPLCERIMAWEPDLVITADNGSTDEPRIAQLAAAGVDVIVTDHHKVEGSGPASSLACVNPSRVDSKYPDPAIAGCGVAFLVMCMTRAVLLERGVVDAQDSRMNSLIDYVALGTVADCVSLGASVNNRAFVRYGLKLINRQQRPCWSVALDTLRSDQADAGTLGFQIGPRINARTRLSEPMAAISYLAASTPDDATQWFDLLTQENEKRKSIEKDMRNRAFASIEGSDHFDDSHVLVVSDKQGHPGVHGICASRIVERFGRPTVLLSPKVGCEDTWTASCRSIPGYNMHSMLARTHERHPELMVAWGGHEGAAGLTLSVGVTPDDFARAIEPVAAEMGCESGYAEPPQPVIWYDGHAPVGDLSMDTLQRLAGLAPWGRGFEAPTLTVTGRAKSARAIGADKTHVKLALMDTDCGASVDAIWFGALEEGDDLDDLLLPGEEITLVARPQINRFRGRESVQLLVEDCCRGTCKLESVLADDTNNDAEIEDPEPVAALPY